MSAKQVHKIALKYSGRTYTADREEGAWVIAPEGLGAMSAFKVRFTDRHAHWSGSDLDTIGSSLSGRAYPIGNLAVKEQLDHIRIMLEVADEAVKVGAAIQQRRIRKELGL